MSESKITTDHNQIKLWAEERNAKPARVKGTNEQGGLLRLNFPDYESKDLENIEWNEFFDAFDKNNLALLYQEKTEDGEKSNFNKLIDREENKENTQRRG